MQDQVIEHGAGYWFELGDSEGLASCIREMISDRAGCAAMGQRARTLFESRYTCEASATKYADVFRLALASECGGPPADAVPATGAGAPRDGG